MAAKGNNMAAEQLSAAKGMNRKEMEDYMLSLDTVCPELAAVYLTGKQIGQAVRDAMHRGDLPIGWCNFSACHIFPERLIRYRHGTLLCIPLKNSDRVGFEEPEVRYD